MPQKTTKSLSGRLTAKAGPLPVYAWALLAIGAFYLYNRSHRSTTPAAATPASSAATGTPNAVGGTNAAGTGAGLGFDTTALVSSLQSLSDQLALNQLNAMTPTSNAGGGGPGGTVLGGSSTDIWGNPLPPGHKDTMNYDWLLKSWGYSPSEIWAIQDRYKKGVGFPTGPAGSTGPPPTSYPAGGGTPAGAAAVKAKPFGGIVQVRTLANGAKLTIYASGRQVEQVPGKTPYVVKA